MQSPFNSLKSFKVVVIVLSYYGFLEEARDLLRQLSNNSRLYTGKHCFKFLGKALTPYVHNRLQYHKLIASGGQPLYKQFQWPTESLNRRCYGRMKLDTIYIKQKGNGPLRGVVCRYKDMEKDKITSYSPLFVGGVWGHGPLVRRLFTLRE